MIEDHHSVSRRSFLMTTGGASVIGLTGCIGNEPEQIDGGGGNGGDSNSGDGTIRMQTATSTTAAYAANQGIAAAVNENTGNLFVEAQPSSGTEANVGALAGGEAEMVYIQNWTVADVVEGVEPFGDLDVSLNQVFHYYDLPWFFCSANQNMESIADIGESTTVSPTPRGSGTAAALEQALGYAVDNYDRISIDYGAQASAMNENRLGVGVGTYMNFEIVPGWLQQMMGTVDLRVLNVPDEVVQSWEDDDRLMAGSFPGGDLENTTFAPEKVWAPSFAYNFVCRNDLTYDAVYEFLQTLYENRDGLSDFHALLGKLENEKFWTQNMYEIPFHPAAADFYQEVGLWREEFERGDE